MSALMIATSLGLTLPLLGQAQRAASTTTATDGRGSALAQEPACQTLTLASTGGPMPKNPSVMVLRWLATSNFEIAYRDNVILLDAYYDRAPSARPLGFDYKTIKKATAIIIGHAHDDHISDATEVALRTGAKVYGGPQSIDTVRAQGLPATQAVLTKGGETVTFNGVTVQAILAHHSVREGPQFQKAGEGFRAIYDALMPPRSDEETKKLQAIASRGSRDQRLQTEGTIAFLFTFDNGYRFYFQDSAGPITDQQTLLLRDIPFVDLASIAYQGFWVAQPQIDATMPLVKLVKPRVLVLNHHDETGGRFLDMASEPMLQAYRDAFPQGRGYSLLYRSPMCVNLSSREVWVGP
jgi:L-ascorbate metabolism protein UlaG (beta-lactamase superfamily)